MKLEASKKLIVDTSCCVGYKEFTFYRNVQTDETFIINSTSLNYIQGIVTQISDIVSISFPSLLGKILNEKSVEVLENSVIHSYNVTILYPGNNTISFVAFPYGVRGTFTIRIWINQLELI